MHHSLEGFFFFFSGHFASVRIGVRGQSFPSPGLGCYLKDNEHSELYWLRRNNYAASEPAGQQGEQDSELPPCAPLALPSALCCLSGAPSPAAARVPSAGAAAASLRTLLPGREGSVRATT